MPQQAAQQRRVLERCGGARADARRHATADIEGTQLLLNLEGQIEGQQEQFAAFDVAALVCREGRKVMSQRHDRDRFRQAVHRRDIRELRPMRVLLQILHDHAELPGQKAIRIGKGKQQRLHVQPLGRRFGIVAGDGCLVEAAIERELVDEMRVVPRPRRHR